MLPNFPILLNKIFAFIVYNAPTNLNYTNAFGHLSVFGTPRKENIEIIIDNNIEIIEEKESFISFLSEFFSQIINIISIFLEDTFYIPIIIIIIIFINRNFLSSALISFYSSPLGLLFKTLKDNLIIASLFLILTKVIFPTTFLMRIFLFIFFSLFSTGLNLRHKIKIPISAFLRNFLGFEYYSQTMINNYTIKEDLLYTFISKRKYKFISTILFEIIFLFRYFFQCFYFWISAFRFICDNNPMKYLFSYYFLLFYILYLDSAVFLSYFALFLILTKVLVYLKENNLQEIKFYLINYQLCPKLEDENFRYTYKNIKIFIFWNIRDLFFFSSYSNPDEHFFSNNVYFFIRDMLKINNLVDDADYYSDKEEIKFDLKKRNNIFSFSLFPLGGVLIQRIDVIHPSLFSTALPYERRVLAIFANHDIIFRELTLNNKYYLLTSSQTSTHNSMMRKGASILDTYKGFVNLSATTEVPLIAWEFASESSRDDYFNSNFKCSSPKNNIHYTKIKHLNDFLQASTPKKKLSFFEINLINKLTDLQLSSFVDFQCKRLPDFQLINALIRGEDISKPLNDISKIIFQEKISLYQELSLRGYSKHQILFNNHYKELERQEKIYFSLQNDYSNFKSGTSFSNIISQISFTGEIEGIR